MSRSLFRHLDPSRRRPVAFGLAFAVFLLAAWALCAPAGRAAFPHRGLPAVGQAGFGQQESATRGDPDDVPEPGPIRRAPDAPPWPDGFELGLQAARAYSFHFGLIEDDTLLARINRIGYRVASQTGSQQYLFTFHLLDVPDPNAFALPGGFIFLTKGMADLHLPDAAMANLLGHEISHVMGNHFARAGRLSVALSLLNTAAIVAAVLAAPASHASGGYDRDPETGEIRTSLSGKDAAIQGTSLFGGVFRELLLRGYSRGLEFEADDRGRQLADRAGYPSTGCVELMDDLHRHIFEEDEYGYWHTHPYFADRIARARAAQASGGFPPDSTEVISYRVDASRRLSALAASIQDEPTSLFLYRAALQASPGSGSSLQIDHALARMRRDRLHKEKPVLRAFGPVLADYDSLLSRAKRQGAPADTLHQLQSERDALDRQRLDQRARSLALLERPNAGTPFLELFLLNYPEDAEAPRVRYRLAERYRLSDRPDEAALALALLSGPEWDGRTVEAMRQVLPLARELTTTQKILGETPSEEIRKLASDRLQLQVAGLDSLELGSRFLTEFPASPVAKEVTEKVESLAMQRYYQARLRESLQDFQSALDGYNELILLAPETKAAGLAREGIERIQTTAGR